MIRPPSYQQHHNVSTTKTFQHWLSNKHPTLNRSNILNDGIASDNTPFKRCSFLSQSPTQFNYYNLSKVHKFLEYTLIHLRKHLVYLFCTKNIQRNLNFAITSEFKVNSTITRNKKKTFSFSMFSFFPRKIAIAGVKTAAAEHLIHSKV